jgi:hypothetical protein
MAWTPILYRSIVPTIDLAENLSPQYIVTQSPQEFRVVQYPVTSFSQSYINWNIIPPSPDTIISRYVRVTLSIHVVIDGHNTANVGANIVNTLHAGFCAYPLHQIINTLTINFNNQAITIKPSKVITSCIIIRLIEKFRSLQCLRLHVTRIKWLITVKLQLQSRPSLLIMVQVFTILRAEFYRFNRQLMLLLEALVLHDLLILERKLQSLLWLTR